MRIDNMNGLKRLTTPRAIEAGMKVIVTETFFAYRDDEQFMFTIGEVITIDRVYGGSVEFNGGVELDKPSLRRVTLPFQWTSSTRPGYEKATVNPWK